MKHLLSILFFAGIVGIIFEIDLYRDTVIDWKIPTAIWFGMGILTLNKMRKYLRDYYDTEGLFLQFVFCVVSFGGLVTYGFMAGNYYLVSNDKIEVIQVPVRETGNLAKGKNGCGNPYAIVSIKGTEKELVFPCDFEIGNYQFVTLKIQRGLFGYYKVLEKVAGKE